MIFSIVAKASQVSSASAVGQKAMAIERGSTIVLAAFGITQLKIFCKAKPGAGMLRILKWKADSALRVLVR